MTEMMMLKAEKNALQQRMEETEQLIKELVLPYRERARRLTLRLVELGDKAKASGYRLSDGSFVTKY
jgi:hypothetical protein